MLLSVLLFAAGAIAASGAALQARAASHALQSAERAVRRAHHVQRERRLLAEAQARAAQVQAVTEGVALGANVVKAVHLGIASMPFSVLEAIPVTRGVTRVVRGVHDAVTHTVYGAIGLANRALGLGFKLGAVVAAKKPDRDPGSQ